MSDTNKIGRRQLPTIFLFSVLFLFFIQLLVDFVEGIYAFGLAGTSIPPEIIAILLFFAPLLMLLFRRGIPGWAVVLVGEIMVISRAVEVMLPTRGRMLVAGVGVACFLILFPSLIWYRGRLSSKTNTLVIGMSLALALTMAVMFRVVNSSLDITTDGGLRWLGWLLAFLLGILILRLYPSLNLPESGSEHKSNAGFGEVTRLSLGIMAAIIMLYFTFIAPNVIERWTEGNYLLVVSVIVIVLGLFAAVLVFRPSWLRNLSLTVVWIWNLVFVFALVATIYINQIDFPVEVSAYPLYAPEVPVWSLILLLMTLVLFPIVLVDFMLFYRELVAIKPSYPQLGGGFASAGFFAMLMVLAHVFTTVYDYIPVVGPFFRDKLWFVYLLVGVVMIMALFLVRTATHERTAMSEDDKLPYSSFILVAIFAFITITAAILFDPQPGSATKETNSLKILTYNIQQGYSDGGLKNYDGQLDLIREIDADIIGLQESDTNRIANGNADVVRYFAERLNMYTYFGPKTVTGTFGDALLSKYPIENPRTFYMYSEGEQTATIEAQITVEGETFNVYVTHLGNGGPLVQQQQVLEVVEGIENVILIGDFNFRPYEDQYAVTIAVLEDAWIVRWPGGNDHQGIDPTERIDHTFLTPGMTIIDSEYIPDPASDHPAMWTVISW